MKIVLVFLFLGTSDDYPDNMSEQIDVVEVKSEPNESDELLSVFKNTNMVDNHSMSKGIASKGINQRSFLFYYIFE